mmetsp:Transcript_19672/g.32245  ORF Transcript_19672/g.32245 Transcript_19672/m.32245 type:complete len:2037 (+) Transcript_19672:238-6348(+)
MGESRWLSLLGVALLWVSCAYAADVLMHRKDLRQTGWYSDEGKYLTPEVVSSANFTRTFATKVDGQIYGQMLTYKGTLFAVTQMNKVYALNAYTGAILWVRQFGGQPFDARVFPTPWGICEDISPVIGITSTPVIDPRSDTIFVQHKQVVPWGVTHYMHGLDVKTGKNRPGFPVEMTGYASNNPNLPFVALRHFNRVALLLLDDVVYSAFGGHCDTGNYQGWVIGVHVRGYVTTLWTSNPANKGGGGIWMSGGMIASDRPGSMIFSVGNGNPSGNPAITNAYNMAVVRLVVNKDLSLNVSDYFIPANAQRESDIDSDFGSGGVAVVPPAFGTDLVIAMGKLGWVYQLNGSNFGGFAGGSDRAYFKAGKVDNYPASPAFPTVGTQMGHSFATVAIFGPTNNGQGYMYTMSMNDAMYCLTNVRIGTKTVFSPIGRWDSGINGWGASSPVVTSDGNIAESGIVWVSDMADRSGARGSLRAYRAVPNAANRLELLKAIPIPAMHYQVPVASYGRVFIAVKDTLNPDNSVIHAYGGPQAPAPPPTPTFNPRAPTPSRSPSPTRTAPPPEFALYIDVGAIANYTDGLGRLWIADKFYDSGINDPASAWFFDKQIAGCPNGTMRVFQTERWGGRGTPPRLTYNIPVPKVGMYTVQLFFVETWWTATGKRLLDIYVQGTKMVSGYDVWADVGAQYTLASRTLTGAVTSVAQGFSFSVVGVADNPILFGIILTSSGPLVTPGPAPTYDPDALSDSEGPEPVPTPFALYLDCGGGGQAVKDGAGRIWKADAFFNGGTSATNNGAPIVGAPAGMNAVLATEHWGGLGVPTTLIYSIPIDPATAGSYTITLYFAEIYWTAPKARVFDVYVNEVLVLDDFDPFGVTGGTNILFTSRYNFFLTDAAIASGKVDAVIRMVASVNNPNILALSVVYDDPQPTPTPSPSPTRGPGTLEGELDPLSIPKYVNTLINPLAPAFIWTPVSNTARNSYRIGVFQAFQNVLGPNFQNTRIFGYGNVANPSQSATWPGRSFEVMSNVAINVTWSNNLVDSQNRPLNHFLPIDPTVPWANPLSLGDDIGARASNGPIPVAIHVHGTAADQYSDGHPMSWFTPAYTHKGSFFRSPTSIFPNQQEAGTPWYHDHTMGITRINVYAGLAGFYFVRDSRDTGRSNNPLGLPTFPYEIGLAIQDRRFDTNHQLLLPSNPETDLAPSPSIHKFFFGRVMIVNGKAWPVHAVEPRKYRLRLLNGCNDRTIGLTFPGGSFTQIGVDDGFLNHPVTFQNGQSLVMISGERADIIVDFSQWASGSEVILRNTAPIGDGTDLWPGLDDVIMKFTISRPLSVPAINNGAIRTTYRLAPYNINSNVLQTRRLGIFERTDEYGRMLMKLGTRTKAYAYNDPITEIVAEDTTEIWEIHNFGAMMHPMHLHLVGFRVLNRYNLRDPSVLFPPAVNENGPKDMVAAPVGMATRVMVYFPRGMTGDFVWHCHTLSHEDHDMMRPFRVVPKSQLPLALLPTEAPTPTAAPTIPPGTVVITQDGPFFYPSTITVAKGSLVMFIFNEPLAHNLARVSGPTDESPLSVRSNNDEAAFYRDFLDAPTFSVRFRTPGQYFYVCQPHAARGMRGVINVVEEYHPGVASFTPFPVSIATPTRSRIVTSSPSFTPAPLLTGSFSLYIDCGSNVPITDPATGITYIADAYYDTQAITATATSQYQVRVAGTGAQAGQVFNTERYGLKFGYRIPVPTSGMYSVQLCFTEVYWQQPNMRVFDVSLQGQIMIRGLDLFSYTGGRAVMYCPRFTIFAANDRLISLFLNATVDNAEILSIGIIQLAPTPTSTRGRTLGRTPTPTRSPTRTHTPTRSPTRGRSPTRTRTPSRSPSRGPSATRTPRPSRTPVRTPFALYLDCGSTSSFTDTLGQSWVPDRYFNGGNVETFPSTIADSVWGAQRVFQSERWGGIYNSATRAVELIYTIPIPNPGRYSVTVYFVETYWSRTGARIMNVYLEGTRVLQNYDLWAETAQQYKLVSKTFQGVATGNTFTVKVDATADNPILFALILKEVV